MDKGGWYLKMNLRDDSTDEIDGVVDDPVDLGATPQGVRVLHPVAETVTLWKKKASAVYNYLEFAQ